MSNAEFDRHAASYKTLHKNNISISGEEPAYFSDYKMRDFKALLPDLDLPSNGRYLDFGSGIGSSIIPFQMHIPDARLVCADVSLESLRCSKESHGNSVDYALIIENKLPFDDAEFDGAFACCVFHHIPHEHHKKVLSELSRVLKPGGLLMVYEHNPFNPLTVHAVRTCPFDENAVLLTARKLIESSNTTGLKHYRTDYRVFFPATFANLRPLEEKLRWLPLGAQYFVAFLA
ncbi:MAG: class I SAM-dependent methyltransferase [Candidatus Moraniibacteriota bacterium]|nr:MAG: class I SAM-dependent methyltransferase [Candidatus Moranbacteria bacterium]